MKIESLWATPVASTVEHLSADSTRLLVDLLLRRDGEKKKARWGGDPFKEMTESGEFYHSIHYNLFDLPDDAPERGAIDEFERLACRTIRRYLAEGYGARDAETVRLSARCFGHIHYPGQRTFPHYHQQSDVVLVHYLKVDAAQESPLSLVMLDPKGAPNYPWWGKMHTINPEQGTTVCHPSYLWHETNEWSGGSFRAMIAANFKVLGHGHEEQFRVTRY